MKPGEVIRIYVGEDDILQGVRQSRSCCPIALSLKGSYDEVNVGNCYAFMDCGNENSNQRVKLRLSEEARQFIRDFDMGRMVHPGIYTAVVAE